MTRQADDADVGLVCCFYSRDIGHGWGAEALEYGIGDYIEIKYMCMGGQVSLGATSLRMTP